MMVRWVGLAVLLLSIPLAFLAPAWVSFENGPIENLQVVVLLLGAATAVAYARQDGPAPLNRWFWWAAVPIWVAMAARELSWGAVFLDPVSITAEGPQFSSDLLWYKPMVKPVLAVVLLLVVLALFRGGVVRGLASLTRARKLPVWDLLLFAGAMTLSAGAEGHLGLTLLQFGEGQVTEETAELAGYAFLMSLQVRLRLGLLQAAAARGESRHGALSEAR